MSIVWVLVIVAGFDGAAGRAIDASLSFKTEAECREAQKVIADETDLKVGLYHWRAARAACIKRTVG